MKEPRSKTISRRRTLGLLAGFLGGLLWLGPGGVRRAAAFCTGGARRLAESLPDGAPRPAPDVLAMPCGHGLALWRRGASAPFATLNEAAADAWRLCDGTRRPAQLAAELARCYEVEEVRAHADCLVLLAQLRRRGAIRW